MQDMIIVPECRSFITPLTPQEFVLLEADILEHGCRDPLVVWARDKDGGGAPVLLDGHHRHRICQEHGLDFKTIVMDFPSEEEALAWMIDNQLGRRNLLPRQVRYFRGRRYNLEKAQVSNPDGRNQHGEVGGHCGPQPKKTADRLAEHLKTSARTLKRDGAFAAAVEAIADNVGPEARQKILDREARLTRKDILLISQKTTAEEQRSLFAYEKKEFKEELKKLKTKYAPAKQGRSHEPLEPVVARAEETPADDVGAEGGAGPDSPATLVAENSEQAAGKIIGPDRLDEVLLMEPETVAMMITTGPRDFVEGVARYLSDYLAKERRRAESLATINDTPDTSATQEVA